MTDGHLFLARLPRRALRVPLRANTGPVDGFVYAPERIA